MPQLMPFLWILSVYMSFMLLMVLIIVYNFIIKKSLLEYIEGSCMSFEIKW